MDKLQIRIGVVILVLFMATAMVSSAARVRQFAVQAPVWKRVANHLGEWDGEDLIPDRLFGSDPADSSLLRVYHSVGSSPVIVYSGFHKDFPTTLDYHTPQICYPAQGWAIESEGRCVAGKFRGKWVQAREMKVYKDGDRRLVIWWYHAGSDSFENRIRQVYRLMLNSMFTGRSDGTIVRVETSLGNESEKIAQARLMHFSEYLLPQLENALPN